MGSTGERVDTLQAQSTSNNKDSPLESVTKNLEVSQLYVNYICLWNQIER